MADTTVTETLVGPIRVTPAEVDTLRALWAAHQRYDDGMPLAPTHAVLVRLAGALPVNAVGVSS